MLLNCGVGEDSWESLGLQGDPTSPGCSLEGLMLKLNSNTLATWCKEMTHLKRPWCWERLNAGGEGYDKGWDGWMASPTPWTWVLASSGSWWWTGKLGVLQSMGSQRGDMAERLNWTEPGLNTSPMHFSLYMLALVGLCYTWFSYWPYTDGHEILVSHSYLPDPYPQISALWQTLLDIYTWKVHSHFKFKTTKD